MASLSRYFSVLLSFLTVAQASPVSAQSSLNLILARGEPGHPNWGCAFSGNSDLYGLGIRLGIYLQLFSTLLANDLLTVEVQEDAKTTNAIIMIAVFAGMASATWQANMNSVEIFVMSILLSAFLFGDFSPPHIGRFTLLEGDGETLMRGLNGFKKAEQQEKEGSETKRYFATIARSCFGTAKAVFDMWYWLYGRNVLLRNSIESTVCEPLVFLNTQILLSGYQPIPYIILAVISATYEVTFMAWWLFILLPGTFRLVYEVITICFLALFTYRPSRLGELREKTAHWYLGFARLRPKELRMFDRVRMSKETQKKVRKWIMYVKS
jgi:hypothetical protein